MSRVIPLTKSFEAIVDDDWYEMLSLVRWHVMENKSRSNNCYAATGIRSEKMHRIISDCPSGMQVDHINGNTLDNRRKNLRVCINSQNCKNQSKMKNPSSSKYKGVIWSKEWKKWRTRITIDWKLIHIGYFKTEEEAALAYNEAAKKYHGEFAKINIVERR